MCRLTCCLKLAPAAYLVCELGIADHRPVGLLFTTFCKCRLSLLIGAVERGQKQMSGELECCQLCFPNQQGECLTLLTFLTNFEQHWLILIFNLCFSLFLIFEVVLDQKQSWILEHSVIQSTECWLRFRTSQFPH